MRAAWLLAGVACSLRLLASTREAQTATGPYDKVLTLLNNLLLQIDRDAAEDDQDWSAFQQWFTGQEGAATEAVGGLQARLQELAASLTDLRAHHLTTTAQHERLEGERSTAESQLEAANDKRKQEHDAFVKEQLDFEQSIAACERAADLLMKHYGEEKTLEKPDWLSLQAVLSTVRSAVARHKVDAKGLALLQDGQPAAPGSSLYDVYEPSADEGRSIVDQVRQLGTTFASDKQSSMDAESELVAAFNTLAAEKKKIIAALSTQIAELKAVATAASEQIAEKGAAEQAATVSLRNEQSYLSAIRQQNTDVEASYAKRKTDRDDERTALRKAQGLLGASLLQVRARPGSPMQRAAALLRQAASVQRSEILAAAASAASAPEALTDVVSELQGLLTRIAEEHAHEVEHADWCRRETTAASGKQQQHTALAAEAQTSLDASVDFSGAKEEELKEAQEDVKELDEDWQQQTRLRNQLHADFVAQQRDNADAIAALREAEGMLRSHYGSASFVQQGPSARTEAPEGGLTAGYQQVGGGVVQALAELREDFERASADAQQAEEEAQADFTAAESRYTASRTALLDSATQLQQQLQTAQTDQATYKENLNSHQEAVKSAAAYLVELRRSCASLVEHLPARSAERDAEAAAIKDAIAILRSA